MFSGVHLLVKPNLANLIAALNTPMQPGPLLPQAPRQPGPQAPQPQAQPASYTFRLLPDACPLVMSCTTEVSPSVKVTEMLTVEISLPGNWARPIGDLGGVSDPSPENWQPESNWSPEWQKTGA